jgi:hypothetical protein
MLEKMMEAGYCHCGCGQKTKIAQKTRNAIGHIKGQPLRFINGHNNRGENNHNWKGGRTTSGNGYILILCPQHPKANGSGQVLEHIIIAEKLLGKPLPAGCVIHHIDGDGTNNNTTNLAICQNQAYHKLLHKRLRAIKGLHYKRRNG